MSSHTIPEIQFADGNRIPQLGIGTWKLDSADAERVVGAALDLGYRHIDTAAIYGNEQAIGRAIARSGVPRDDLFVTTKLWKTELRDAHGAFASSLERLGLEAVDLYLVHWPGETIDESVAAWQGLVEIQRSGGARSIGVSNFEVEQIDAVREASGVLPVVNQIELHPLRQRRELREYCRAQGIAVEAWSPLAEADARLLAAPPVVAAAAAHNKTPAQVILRWHLQHGVIVFPKTAHIERLSENAAVFDFALNDAEMHAIDGLEG